MAPRIRHRDGEPTARSAAAAAPRDRSAPMLVLARTIGNRGTAQVLARTPAATDYGTVQVGALPAIKITGGNAREWAAKQQPDTLEITSEKGAHSAGLEKLSRDSSRVATLTVTTPAVDQSGPHLDSGSVVIEFVNARITGYTVAGKQETWRAVDFDAVHRKTISHRSGL